MAICLDSNILIRACYPENRESLWLKQQLQARVELLIPAPVVAEVLVKPSAEEKRKLEALFAVCEIVAIDEELARYSAQLRTQALNKGKRNYLQDCYIAAVALTRKANLATNNQADFVRLGVKIQALKINKNC